MLRAFWFSKPLMKKGNVLNFGDELSQYILEKTSNDNVKWVLPQQQSFFERNFTKHVLGIGSILHFGAKNSLIWGSGLIEKKSYAPNAKYYAVRGKFTRKELVSRGFSVPEIYGDPGLLTSKYFNFDSIKKFKVGIIPHYIEFDEMNNLFKENKFSNEFKMIDLRDSVEKVLQEINECELIISSSLHGIIVPHSYNIPTLRVEFTKKISGDGIKYEDYFDSVGIENYNFPHLSKEIFNETQILNYLNEHKEFSLAKKDLISIQENLLSNKPF